MFARVFFCAICAFGLLASPAAAEIITVSDGEDFDRINVTPERELVMNGGRVDLVNNVGGIVTVNGGTTGLLKNEEFQGSDAFVTVNGYEHNSINNDRLLIEIWGGSQVEIHGYNFRADAFGDDAHTIADIHGWLLNGSYVEIRFKRFGSAEGQSLTLVGHDPEFVDPDGDWDFDLADLNLVRNNFGLSGDGDTNFDCVIDLADLNIVRNKFGSGYDQLGRPVEWEYFGEIPLNPGGQWFPPTAVVPEPSAMALALLASILSSATLASRLKRLSRRRDL